MQLKIGVGKDFNLEKVVCNYGYFMTCPNQWQSSTKSLRRPLRLADGSSSVTVSISQRSSKNDLLIDIQNEDHLDLSDQEAIRRQVVRMLRISNKDDEVVRKFQEMHTEARNMGFGRLFRSPDLFEDMVKTILLCNTTWQRTLQMCRALCELQFQLHSVNDDDLLVAQHGQLTIGDFFRKRKRKTSPMTAISEEKTASKLHSKPVGNFPTSKELIGFHMDFLKNHCNLGYRAKYILNLAEMVENGKLKLEQFEGLSFDKEVSQRILKELEQFEGIGPFSAANIVMCLGEYRHIPIDSETINHLQKVHGREDCTKVTVKKVAKDVYDKFDPYQCLAYWCEHCGFYEKQMGEEMSKLSPSSYHKVSGSYLSNKNQKRGATTRIHD